MIVEQRRLDLDIKTLGELDFRSTRVVCGFESGWITFYHRQWFLLERLRCPATGKQLYWLRYRPKRVASWMQKQFDTFKRGEKNV